VKAFQIFLGAGLNIHRPAVKASRVAGWIVAVIRPIG
jgi:hypothetical protein